MKPNDFVYYAKASGVAQEVFGETVFLTSETALRTFAHFVEQVTREECAGICHDHFSSDGAWCAAKIMEKA